MSARLTLHGLQVPTTVGIKDWEQQVPQTLTLDVCLGVDTKAIAIDDSLDKAVDYQAVGNFISQFLQDNHFGLIETLAEAVCQALFETFPIDDIALTVEKPSPFEACRSVSIHIERERGA